MKLVDLSISKIVRNYRLIICIAIILSVSPIASLYILAPYKYVFFGFIGTLTLLLVGLISSSSRYLVYDASSIGNKIDYFFIGCSLFVLLTNTVSLQLLELNLIISETVVFFVPGWFVIRLFRIDRIMRASIPLLVLSFVFSLGVSSLFFSIFLSFNSTSEPIFISAFYLVLSIFVNIIRRKKQHYYNDLVTSTPNKKVNLGTVALLVWIFLFFIFIVSTIYPELADIPGSDIIRHISNANKLLHSQELYTSEYPWFHFTIALTKALSNAPDWMIHTGTAFLSMILILSFYIMANKYLHDLHPKAAILSTVFFSVFSGFGWLYFLLQLNQFSYDENFLKIFSFTNSATYWDVGFGGSTWLWFWFRPLTVGFSILFTCLYLLRFYELPKITLIAIMAFLVVVLSQIHISELVMFVGVIFTTCLFAPSCGLRLKESSFALVIGLALSLLLSNSIPYILNSDYQVPQNSTLLGLIAVTFGSILILRMPRRKFRFPSVNLFLSSAVGVFVYLVLLLSWLNTVDNNSLQKVASALAVPWEFYPVLLGVLGLLTVPSIFIALRSYKRHPIIIFVILFFLSIIFGRIVTYFNLEIGGLGYWERRTVPFVLVAVSILCTLFLFRFIGLSIFKNKTATGIAKVAVVSCLVLFGTFSTLLSVQYQISNIVTNAMTKDERQLQQSLKTMGPDYTVLTANSRASNLVEYYNPGYLIGYYKVQIWPSRSPELPIKVMSVLDNKSSVYLNEGDTNRINRGGFLGSHQIRMGQSIDRDHEGLITFPRMVPPVSRSDLALVLPDVPSGIEYYAYDILSIGGLNYTTVNLSDIPTLNKSGVLLAPTETIGSELKKLKEDYNLKFHDLVILNLDGNNELTQRDESKARLKITVERNKWFSEGINKGSIGVPSLLFNRSALGEELLSIKVDNGSYALWQIYHKFDRSTKFAKYDLFNFDWYGKNDGKYYVIEFNTRSGDSFWYRFQDSWNGWKQVSIPLHEKDGRSIFFGVTMDIVSGKNASWNNVTRINIRTEASNLNNSGTFYIKDLSFHDHIKTSGIQLPSDKIKKFPTSVDVFPITIPTPSLIKAKYENTTIPYLIQETNGKFTKWYVNIYPIVNKMEKDVGFARSMYPKLGDLLLLDFPLKYKVLSKDIRTLVSGGVSAFRSLNGSGNMVTSSESSIVVPHSSAMKIDIDGKVLTFDNIKKVLPLSEEHSIVKSSKVSTTRGYGFYLSALLNNSSISYIGHPARIMLVSNESNNIMYSGNNVTITLANSSIILRQPVMKIFGTILVDDFYAYGDLNNQLRSLGNDMRIMGSMNLAVQTSDEFTVAQNTSLSGTITRNTPLYYYNDVHNLSQLFDYKNIRHILAISVILIIIGIIFNGKRSRFSEARPPNA